VGLILVMAAQIVSCHDYQLYVITCIVNLNKIKSRFPTNQQNQGNIREFYSGINNFSKFVGYTMHRIAKKILILLKITFKKDFKFNPLHTESDECSCHTNPHTCNTNTVFVLISAPALISAPPLFIAISAPPKV
jgi:hypothetical protein